MKNKKFILVTVAGFTTIGAAVALTTNISAQVQEDEKAEFESAIELEYGITPNQIEEARTDGVRLKDLLEEQGVTREEFRNFLQENGFEIRTNFKRGENLEEFLGVSVDQLREDRQAGLNFEEILEKYGRTDTEFKSFLVNEIDEKVESGEISEERAKEIIAKIESGEKLNRSVN